MKDNKNPYHFNRENIYYPLVMNYIYSIHGFIDLASRGLINQLIELKKSTSENEMNELISSLNIIDETIKNEFKQTTKTAPLFAKQKFTKSDGKDIKIDINEIADEILKNGPYLISTLNNSACILLITAFEKSKDWDDQKKPIWNFFYHCRNASAHNNKFKIEKDRFPAKWGALEITKNINGSKLFHENIKDGFLNYGDPIALLWDIEQQYKSMKVK
jgi:hypothetical protein